MKRVLSIQDISCLGKCSTTIALPIISAMGVETTILPTALLSTHTMFEGFTCKDLTDQLMPICQHWLSQNIHFDAIYTGYLGSEKEIELAKKIFKMFKKEDTMIFVDPVMADHGKLYPAFDSSYIGQNASLSKYADILVPNITEAALMTNSEYKEVYDEAYIQELIVKLRQQGAKVVVITGVSLEEGKQVFMVMIPNKKHSFIIKIRKLVRTIMGQVIFFKCLCWCFRSRESDVTGFSACGGLYG